MPQPLVDPWDDSIPRKLEGIRGFLWIALLHLAAVIVFSALGLLKMLQPLRDHANIALLTGHPLFLAATALVALATLALALFGLYCAVLLFRKRAAVPRRMTRWYGLGIVVNVLIAVQFAVNAGVFKAVFDDTATSGSIGMAATRNIILYGFFILYWDISKRVKNTFVR